MEKKIITISYFMNKKIELTKENVPNLFNLVELVENENNMTQKEFGEKYTKLSQKVFDEEEIEKIANASLCIDTEVEENVMYVGGIYAERVKSAIMEC